MLLIYIGDYFIRIYSRSYGFIDSMIRPTVVIITLSAVRERVFGVFVDLYESALILVKIFTYIGFFAIIGFYMFAGSIEGTMYFSSLSQSYYNLLVLITTANFPDIMLPAYNVNFFYSFYFVIYLCFGLYLLLNLLLAKVFSNYRRRLELKVSMRSDNRVKLLEQFYDKFDLENKGFLTLNETKNFFKVTMDLNFRKERDQRLFLNLMRLVDPENNRIVYRERLIGYFSMPGFLDIERLNNI